MRKFYEKTKNKNKTKQATKFNTLYFTIQKSYIILRILKSFQIKCNNLNLTIQVQN